MRKVLLLILVAICNITYAQVEIGINDGISPYTKIKDQYWASYTSKTSNLLSLSASYKISHFKLGIGYNTGDLAVHNSQNVPQLGSTFYYAKPLSDIYLFAEHEHKISRLYIYYGLQAGKTSIKNTDYSDYASASGFSLGGHLGVSYDVWKGILINIQVGAEYLSDKFAGTNYTEPSYTSTVLEYPLTIGVHYKFHFKK
jgi:hypothetical protein